MDNFQQNEGQFSGNAQPSVQETQQFVAGQPNVQTGMGAPVAPKKQGIGSKIGYFFLALLPIITCFALQFAISFVVLVIEIVVAIMAGTVDMSDMNAYMEYVMQVAVDTSPMITGIYHVLSSIAFFVWYYFTFKKPRPTLKKSFAWFNGKTILVVVLVSLLLNLLSNGTVVLESILAPSIVEAYMQLAEIAGLGTDPFVIFAAICLAPIGEELMCRGLTLKFANKAFGNFWVANVFQALIFGVMHANWVQGIYAFIIGIAFGYMTKRYNSIIPAMIGHFVINFVSSTFMPYLLEPVPVNIVSGLLLTIVPAAATIWLFVWDSKKEVA